jgi:predicted RNA binding protein YcfA (HicA-like mRNA interferase family)
MSTPALSPLTSLPTSEEWNKLVSFHKTFGENNPFASEGIAIQEKNAINFHKFLSQPKPDISRLSELFPHAVAIFETGLLQSAHSNKTSNCYVFFNTVSNAIVQRESEQRLTQMEVLLPHLQTMDKVTRAFMNLVLKIDTAASLPSYGPLTPIGKRTIYYFKDSHGLLQPTTIVLPKTSDWYQHLFCTYETRFNHPPLIRAVIVGKEGKPCPEPGFFLRVDQGLIHLSLFSGAVNPEALFCRYPFHLAIVKGDRQEREVRFVNSLIPEGKGVEGYTNFFPIPSDPMQQKLITLSLLEELIEAAPSPEEVAEAKVEIDILEAELIDIYKAQIRKEHETRQRLVISGEINQINKPEKKKPKPGHQHEHKQKEVVSTSSPSCAASSALQNSATALPFDLIEMAKLRLSVEKKRIKKHNFISFISTLKKIYTDDFKGLISQKGSHLTLHTEEKESLTLVVPHKKDSTIPSKILTRFINRLTTLLTKKK